VITNSLVVVIGMWVGVHRSYIVLCERKELLAYWYYQILHQCYINTCTSPLHSLQNAHTAKNRVDLCRYHIYVALM